MARENTPLRGVASDAAGSQRKKRFAAIAGVAVVAAVAVGVWAMSGSSDNTNVGTHVATGTSPQIAPLEEAPAPTTEAPAPTTEAPKPTTEAPVATTEAPVATTEAPKPTTEAPKPTTEAPVATTEAPVATTEAPAPNTEAPVPTTEAPKPTTEAPKPTTKTPVIVTIETPKPTTEAPVATTTAPPTTTEVPAKTPAASSAVPAVTKTTPAAATVPAPIDVHSVACGIANTEAGYITLPNKKADNYFYWYYESRASPSTDPLVVWLTGGPGCSSLMALLTENGPCTVKPDLTTELNPFSWNSHANVIWLDQPTGVGYSYSTETADADKDEDDVGDNFFWFLNGFLDKHPELEGRDLYITGESYAGHYVPAAAHKIWLENKIIKEVGTPVRINLKGIAIGNGLTNPEIQTQHQLDMMNNTYNITLMSPEDYAHAQEILPKCTGIIKEILSSGNFSLTDEKLVECQVVLEPFKNAHRNPYDIRLPCGDVADATQCYDITYVSDYLNSDAVRSYLNVTSNPKKPWIECDAGVGLNFMTSGDVAVNYESYVADLLNDGSVRVLLYVGDADTVCNWYGNKAWATALDWKHKAEFNAAEDHAFVTGNGSVDAGVAKAYSNQFTFLRLFNSGHMVPRDQPAVALEMIEKFFKGETF